MQEVYSGQCVIPRHKIVEGILNYFSFKLVSYFTLLRIPSYSLVH